MDPISIAALIAMVAGTAAQYDAQQKGQRRRAQSLQDELARQRQYRDQAQVVQQQQLQASTPDTVQKQMDDATQQRVDTYQQMTQDAPQLAEQLSGGTTDNKVVKDEFARTNQDAQASSLAQAVARAKLAAFGDAMFQGGTTRARGNQQLAQIGNFAQGSQGVNQYEQQAAAHSADGEALLGSIVSAAGSAALGLHGLGGATAGAQVPTGRALDTVMAGVPGTSGSTVDSLGNLFGTTGFSPKTGFKSMLFQPTGYGVPL